MRPAGAADRLGPGEAEAAGLELAGDERPADERPDDQRQEHQEARQVHADSQVLVLERPRKGDGAGGVGRVRVAEAERLIGGVHAEALDHEEGREASEEDGDGHERQAVLPPGDPE